MPNPQSTEKDSMLTKAEILNQDLAKLNRDGNEMQELFEAATLIITKFESQVKQGTLPEKDKALYQIAKNWIEEKKGQIEQMRQVFMEKLESLKSIDPEGPFCRPASF